VAQNGAATMVSPSPRPVSAGLQNLVGDEVRDVLTEGCMAPNDLVLGPDGLWWFTDPTPLPGQDRGRVCTFDPASGEMRTQIEGIHFPNGLAFGLDPTELYVAASLSHDILRYRVTPDGVEDLGQWGVLPGSSPDGIAFDAQGRLFVAAFLHDSVAVFAPDGQLERTISTGACSRPTNLCFAGDDLRTLVVTAAKGGRLLVVDEEFDGRLPSPWASRVG
jgi:gluconolactonase